MSAFQDWRANSGRPKIQFSLLLYRVSLESRRKYGRRSPVTLIVATIYRLIAEVVGGFEMPTSVVAGRSLRIHHGFGLVVNGGARIGANVVLRQGVCIGSKVSGGAAPEICDDVDFGVNAIVLGDIRVGVGARIGAGSVVLQSVPDGYSAVGNPARLLPPRQPNKHDADPLGVHQVPAVCGEVGH